MKKMRKYARALALAVVLGATGAMAQTDPTGVLSTFDVATAGTAIKAIIIDVLGIIGIVYGAMLGFVFLRWVYRKVVGALGR